MILLTKKIASKLPAIGTCKDKKPNQIKVPLKLFLIPSFTWYIMEYNPANETFYCYGTNCENHEFGFLSLAELNKIKTSWGFRVERDLHWDPNTTLQQVIDREME